MFVTGKRLQRKSIVESLTNYISTVDLQNVDDQDIFLPDESPKPTP